MLLAEQRRMLAFFIYPEIRKERIKLSRADLEKIKRSGVIDRMTDLSRPQLHLSYKAIKDICNRRATTVAVSRGHPLHPNEEHLGSNVVAGQQDDGAGDPSFGQGVEGDICRAVVVSEFGMVDHGSLLGGVGTLQGRETAPPHKEETQRPSILRALARLDDHWIGDLIGVVALFALGWGGLVIGYAAGLK